MSLLRFLLVLGVVVWVARLLWRWLQPKPVPPNQEAAAHSLSRCSRCGTLTPQDLVVWQDERPFCSPACRDGGQV
ncbi:MAG: hypothetical protein HQL80_10815 [Magnetococcales bacterium]|nr:hypothetical protein [Magnetococcales bacterium]MBF0584706.1 hypothetical protein [Magnetococcales bacterium]